MASNPPAQCCTVGVKHEGEPTGSFTTFGNGIEAYVAEPKGNVVHKDTAILYVADVFSIWQNSKLMADQFAANGYHCFLPDLFNKDPVQLNKPEGFDIMAWLTKGTGGNNPHTFEYVDPIIEASIKHLRAQGFKKIGAVGYCFGGKYVVRYLGPSSVKGGGIDVGYTAHPSFVDEDELAAIGGPLSISAAETDSIFPKEKRHKSEEILTAGGKVYQINLFQGVEHGFAVRCDMSVKMQKFAKEQAFLQAIAWFNEYLINA